MRAIEIECPACKAGKKEKCVDVGHADQARNKSGVHVSRARRAHYMTVAERSNNNGGATR